MMTSKIQEKSAFHLLLWFIVLLLLTMTLSHPGQHARMSGLQEISKSCLHMQAPSICGECIAVALLTNAELP